MKSEFGKKGERQMDNNVKVYSCSNVEAMVKSVKSNTEIINNMIMCTKDNDKQISTRLSDYAKVKKTWLMIKLKCIEIMLITKSL